MYNIPRSPVKSKKQRASPHQRVPTVTDVPNTTGDRYDKLPSSSQGGRSTTTKNSGKSKLNNSQLAGEPQTNIKDMASELIEKYSNNNQQANSFANQDQQKPNLNSFELSSRQKRAERLKELGQPIGSFQRKNVTERSGASGVTDKVAGQNPMVKDTPKRSSKGGRGSPLGKHRGSTGGMGQFINSSAKKKSSSQAYINPDDRNNNNKMSSKKKKNQDDSQIKGPIRVEVDFDNVNNKDAQAKRHNALNTGRARDQSDQMTFDFQNDPTESQSITTPVVGMKRDDLQTPQQIISQRSINESDIHGRNSFLMASQKNRLKEREAAQSAAAIDEVNQTPGQGNPAPITLQSQHSQSLASQISQVEGLIQGANKIIDQLPGNPSGGGLGQPQQQSFNQNPRANKVESWKKRDQKAQNINTADNAIFKNPYLNLGRTDQAAKKDFKKEGQKAGKDAVDIPVMVIARSNQRSQQVVKDDEPNKNDTATISVGMIHTPRKSRMNDYGAGSVIGSSSNLKREEQEQTPYIKSPSPQNSNQQKQSNAANMDSAKLHANFLQNQFARDTSSEDLSRSPSLTKNLNNNDPDYQMRQHSLIREQLERKNRETLSKIDDYQEEVGINRVTTNKNEQSYGTNSTFQRDSQVFAPNVIHETFGNSTSMMEASMIVNSANNHNIEHMEQKQDYSRMTHNKSSYQNNLQLQSQKSNFRMNDTDSQHKTMWEEEGIRDHSPVFSNNNCAAGQNVTAGSKSAVGINDEYVEWLEANNIVKENSQQDKFIRSSQDFVRSSQKFLHDQSPIMNPVNTYKDSQIQAADMSNEIQIVENIGISKNMQYRGNNQSKRKSPHSHSKLATPDRHHAKSHKKSQSKLEHPPSRQATSQYDDPRCSPRPDHQAPAPPSDEYIQNLRDLNAEYARVIQQQNEQLEQKETAQRELCERLEQAEHAKEEQEERVKELRFDMEELKEEHRGQIKEREEQYEKKMQGVIGDYEKILATMQQQQDDSSQKRKDVEAKLMETENKYREQEALLKEKDDKIISLEQKALYYDDKIREIEKELEFERQMSQLAQQNLKKAEKEKEEVLEEKKKELEKAQEASILVTENLEASMAQLKVKEEEIRSKQQKEEKDLVNEKIIHQLKNNNEVLQQQNILMDGQLRKLQQDFQCQMLIEQEIRTKNEQVLNTVRQLEYVNRQKDEELQAQRKNVEIAQRDLKNLAWSEQQLKLEITQLNQKRIESEEIIQQFKQQICAQWIFQKQKDMEVESLVRENRSLQANYQLIQQTVLDNSSEINRHKEHSSYFEREKFNLKNQLDQYQREISRLNEENLRVGSQLQRERSDRADEFTRLNAQLSNQRDQLATQLEQIESQQNQINNLQKQQLMQQEKNMISENNLKQQLQTAREEMMTQRKRPMSVTHQRASELLGNRTDREDERETEYKNHEDNDNEEEEETQNMTIRERYLKMQNKQENNNQPSKKQGIRWASQNETDDDNVYGDSSGRQGQNAADTPQNNNGGSTIQWASRAKSMDKSAHMRSSIAFPSQMQQQEKNDVNIKNQNDSQLYDILGWQSTRNNMGGPYNNQQQMQTERPNSENRYQTRASTSNDDPRFRKSMAHHNMFDSSQAPWGQQAGTERQGQGGGGGQSAFNRRYTQQQEQSNISWLPKQPSHHEQYEQEVSNYHNRQGNGGGADLIGSGSGFNFSQIGPADSDQLERQLSLKMIEKDQLEQEFWRIGSKSKTKQDIMKKRELETALERSKQNIQQIKNRLKDLK